MVRRRTRPNIFKHRPGAVHEPVDRRRHALPMGPSFEERRREPVTRTVDAAADEAYRQRFGNYAGLAEAELTTYRDLDDDAPDHANSNTARTSPGAEEEAVVVPFPTAGSPPLRPLPSASPRHWPPSRSPEPAIRAPASASNCGAKRRRSAFP